MNFCISCDLKLRGWLRGSSALMSVRIFGGFGGFLKKSLLQVYMYIRVYRSYKISNSAKKKKQAALKQNKCDTLFPSQNERKNQEY